MRSKKVMLNSLAEIIPYIILGIIGFIKVRVIIDNLGSELNGYYQFINQVISYVFLIEAGFASAVIYKLYKPFAESNETAIEAIFNGARKIFRNIGFIIVSLILVLTFILPPVFNIADKFVWEVMIGFLIISLTYLIPYFGKGNAYYAMFCADQKKYVYSLTFNTLKIICDIAIIFVAMWFQSLIIIAVVILIIKIIEEISIRIMSKIHFPFMGKTNKEDTTSFSMTKDLVWHQLSFMVSNNTDVVVLLLFVNPIVVSIYTTYNFIARFLNEFTTRINNVVSYSFGNMFAQKKHKKKMYQINEEYFIFSAFIAMVIGLTFVLAIRPFVGIWIGNVDYYVQYFAIILFGLNLFLWTIYNPLVAVINAKGLYKSSKYIVLLSAGINVFLTIIFVYIFKGNGPSMTISAVLMATVVANLVNIALRLKLVIKQVFPDLKYKNILFEYLAYTIIFVETTVAFKFIEDYLFKIDNILNIIGAIIILFGAVCLFSFIILFVTKHNSKLLLIRIHTLLSGK